MLPPMTRTAARRFLQKNLKLAPDPNRFDIRSYPHVGQREFSSLAVCTNLHFLRRADSEGMSIFCERYELSEAIESAQLN